MKRLLIILLSVFMLMLSNSCDELEKDNDSDPNVIGGNTDVGIGQVGNTISNGRIYVGNNSIDFPAEAKVTKNEGGIATLNLKANILDLKNSNIYRMYKDQYNLDDLLNRIPSQYLDNEGNLDAEVAVKITSEGIQDFVNRDGKAHTIVKFDAKVGDEYKLTKSNGHVLTRKVTERSDEDDFPYGFYYIKTITVEQPSAYPGVQKFTYKANHRFGIVHVEALLDDGSKVSTYIYSQNEM